MTWTEFYQQVSYLISNISMADHLPDLLLAVIITPTAFSVVLSIVGMVRGLRS